MAHTRRHRTALLARVRRIRGQVEALERALEAGRDCSEVLHLIAAARGGMNGLMAVVLEGHVREHVLGRSSPAASRAAEDVVALVRSYLR